MATEPKNEALLLRMGRTEARMLRELSERTGLTKADVLRQFVRKGYAETFDATHDKPARTGRKR